VNREASHHGLTWESANSDDLVEQLKTKASLEKFLKVNNLETDINRGKFLHLYADWEFYNNFLSKKYLKSVTLERYLDDLKYTSNTYDDYLITKHKLSFSSTSRENECIQIFKMWNNENAPKSGTLIFTRQELDDFIEQISSVDIDKLALKFH
jgi:hypothetical protein